MKILIAAIALLGVASLSYAVTKQAIAGGPSVLTAAQLNAATPAYAGQPVVCSNCAAANAGTYNFCLSSGTGIGAWIIISSASAVTACR